MNSPREYLFVMLSQLLIAYTEAFDAVLTRELQSKPTQPPPSLAMWANVLQFVDARGVPARSLPSLSGIAKPTVMNMLSYLARHGWIAIDDKDIIRLTDRGANAQRAWTKALQTVECQWEDSLGAQTFHSLQASLQTAAQCLAPGLPQYPMTAAHRGAFPRGA
jgi:hypothetical protein